MESEPKCTGYPVDPLTQDDCCDTSCPRHHLDEDAETPEEEDAEWCELCHCPIGVGTCGGCISVGSILPPYHA